MPKLINFEMNINLILYHRNRTYPNSELFNKYISVVLIANIEEQTNDKEFADRNEILLMDNCSIHTNQITN